MVTDPIVVSEEGRDQVITGAAFDIAGNGATASELVSLDKTSPLIEITGPEEGAVLLVPETIVTGTVSDSLAGIDSVACNGIEASVADPTFSCELVADAGANLIEVQAADVAGNSSSTSITVFLQSGPIITGFTPNSGPIGTLVTIAGSGLSPGPGAGPQVTLNRQGGGTISAPVAFATGESIGFSIPAGAATGPLVVTVAADILTSADPLEIVASNTYFLRVARPVRPASNLLPMDQHQP